MTTVTPPPPPPPPPAQGVTPGANTVVVANPPAGAQTLSNGQAIEALVLAQLSKGQVEVQTILGALKLQTTYPLPKNAVITLVVTHTGAQQLGLQIAAVNGNALPGQILPPGPAIVGGPASGQAGGQPAAPTATTQGAPAGTDVPLAPGARIAATLVRPTQATMTQTANPPVTAPNTTVVSSTPGATLPATGLPGGAAASAPSTLTTSTPSGGTRTGASTPGPSATPAPASPLSATPAAQGGGTTTAPAGQAASTTPSSAPGAAPAPAQSVASGTPGAPSTNLPAGTRLMVSVVQVQPGGQPGVLGNVGNIGNVASMGQLGQGAVTLSTGATLIGTVSGQTPAGQPIVQTPAATFALATRQPLPIGTQMTLSLETIGAPAKTPAAATALANVGTGEALAKAGGWETLSEAMKLLQSIDAGGGANVLRAAIPQPGTRVTSQILFFLAALRGGDIRGWLGELPGRLLERDRPTLLNRLGAEFQVMGKMAGEHSAGDWRLALIPFLSGAAIEQVRLYQRKSRPDDEEAEREGQRFILDFALSRIGHMQIDGLFKKQRNRVDLIVRTDTPLPREAQHAIAQIYTEAAELTGIGGGLAFQAAPGNFIDFPPLEPDEPHPGLVV